MKRSVSQHTVRKPIQADRIESNLDVTFDVSLLRFLKRAAEEGLDLQQVTVNVFDEVFNSGNNIPFDGSLSSFSMFMLDSLELRRQLGTVLLDVLMPAAVENEDIYQLISKLEGTIKSRTGLRKIAAARKRLANKRVRPPFPAATGVPKGSRRTPVLRVEKGRHV